MPNQEQKTKLSLYERVSRILFILVMFLIIGELTPPFIVSLTPASKYYSIVSPATTNKRQYRAGEFMTLEADRTSGVTVHADSVQELVLISASGEKTEMFHDTHHIPLLEGETDVAMRIQIPADIEPGIYFWHGVIFFEVRGVEKNYPWNSITFEVIK